jgi:hypothetical protein
MDSLDHEKQAQTMKNFVCRPFNESVSVITPKIMKNRPYQPGD